MSSSAQELHTRGSWWYLHRDDDIFCARGRRPTNANHFVVNKEGTEQGIEDATGTHYKDGTDRTYSYEDPDTDVHSDVVKSSKPMSMDPSEGAQNNRHRRQKQ